MNYEVVAIPGNKKTDPPPRLVLVPSKPFTRGGYKDRPLAPKWEAVLNFIGGKGTPGVSTTEVMSFIKDQELDIKVGSLRSAFWNYKKQGWIEPVRISVVRLTDAGAARLKRDAA